MKLTQEHIGKKVYAPLWMTRENDRLWFIPLERISEDCITGILKMKDGTFVENAEVNASYRGWELCTAENKSLDIKIDEAIKDFGCHETQVRHLVALLSEKFVHKEESK